jgi:hypothetical protein
MEEPKKIALSFLAYGEEHVSELNHLLFSLKKYKDTLDIFIVKDKNSHLQNDGYSILEINEPFNYNLKRLPVRESLINHDIVLFIDTDTKIKNCNLELLNNLKDGIYVNWVNNVDNIFYEQQITLKGFIDNTIKTHINLDYFQKLESINVTNENILFIRESFFIIKLSDNIKKKRFIFNWDKLVNDMKFNELSNNKEGVMEGLLIYLSCILSDINVYDIQKNKSVNKFFNDFNHLGDYILKDMYNNKTLI